MARVKVTNEMRVHEIGGQEVEVGRSKSLLVRSHWNRREFVVLAFGDAEITVDARSLKAAIENATNTGGV